MCCCPFKTANMAYILIWFLFSGKLCGSIQTHSYCHGFFGFHQNILRDTLYRAPILLNVIFFSSFSPKARGGYFSMDAWNVVFWSALHWVIAGLSGALKKT